MVSNGFQSEVAYSNFYFENITGAVLVREEAEGEVVKRVFYGPSWKAYSNWQLAVEMRRNGCI